MRDGEKYDTKAPIRQKVHNRPLSRPNRRFLLLLSEAAAFVVFTFRM
jgi:hypothetical protein